MPTALGCPDSGNPKLIARRDGAMLGTFTEDKFANGIEYKQRGGCLCEGCWLFKVVAIQSTQMNTLSFGPANSGIGRQLITGRSKNGDGSTISIPIEVFFDCYDPDADDPFCCDPNSESTTFVLTLEDSDGWQIGYVGTNIVVAYIVGKFFDEKYCRPPGYCSPFPPTRPNVGGSCGSGTIWSDLPGECGAPSTDADCISNYGPQPWREGFTVAAAEVGLVLASPFVDGAIEYTEIFNCNCGAVVNDRINTDVWDPTLEQRDTGACNDQDPTIPLNLSPGSEGVPVNANQEFFFGHLKWNKDDFGPLVAGVTRTIRATIDGCDSTFDFGVNGTGSVTGGVNLGLYDPFAAGGLLTQGAESEPSLCHFQWDISIDAPGTYNILATPAFTLWTIKSPDLVIT